jgi:hypothetical protein
MRCLILLLEPGLEIGSDELLCAGAAAQAEPRRATLAVQPYVDIEEWAAGVFTGGPRGYDLKCRAIAGKFEFVAVGYFANSPNEGAQLGPEFVEMQFTLVRAQCEAVAGEWGLLRRGRDDGYSGHSS